METLSPTQVVNLLLAISAMIIIARLLGEAFRYISQPPVIGEILAGVILGPTILGTMYPEIFQNLFPEEGPVPLALDGFVAVSKILLLFIAGLEVELNIVRQQGKQTFFTSFFSMLVPFILGFALPYAFPPIIPEVVGDQVWLFALFMGTSMSITALPVIARILIDLGKFKTPMGMIIVSSAMVNDLIGWLVFSIILGMLGTTVLGMGIGTTIMLTLAFAILMLTIGKYLINKVLPLVNTYFSWPGGLLSFVMALCFLGAAFTELIGIHSIFGAFIVGVAIGDSVHMSDRAKEIIHQFVNNIFAPLFFVSIGLKVNFVANFDLTIVLLVMILAFIGKIFGTWIGARMSGFSSNESLIIGSGMNARGAMEIILGLLALEAGLINEVVFVALVVMALFTSIASGPMMDFFLRNENSTKNVRSGETLK